MQTICDQKCVAVQSIDYSHFFMMTVTAAVPKFQLIVTAFLILLRLCENCNCPHLCLRWTWQMAKVSSNAFIQRTLINKDFSGLFMAKFIVFFFVLTVNGFDQFFKNLLLDCLPTNQRTYPFSTPFHKLLFTCHYNFFTNHTQSIKILKKHEFNKKNGFSSFFSFLSKLSDCRPQRWPHKSLR